MSNVKFVTGASGFIGQKLVSALNKKKFKTRLLSRNMLNENTIKCDLTTDQLQTDTLVGIDTVYHLAGFAHNLKNDKNMSNKYYKLNVDATINLAKLALKSNVKKFVFVSSVKAGGVPAKQTIANEETQGKPDGIYGETKKKAELALFDITQNSNMHVSIIRPSLVYGPNMKGNLALMLEAIKRGWFPPLPDLDNKRSMIHVDDLVQAILLVSNEERANRKIFIATDNSTYSSRDIYDTMRTILGKDEVKWHVPREFFTLASLVIPYIGNRIDKLFSNQYYSSAKLQSLGFKSKYSLKDMNKTEL